MVELLVDGLGPALCFFSVGQVFGDISLSPGTPLLVSAKCVNPTARVPYLALILWSANNPLINPMLVNNVMSRPPEQQAWSQYLQCADQLHLHLQSTDIQQPVQPRHTKRQPPHPRNKFNDFSQSQAPANKRPHLDGTPPFGSGGRVSRPRQMSFVVTNLTEEFPHGTKAVVDKYFSRGVGQLSVVNSSGKKLQQVLFHVNHVWKNVDNSFGKHNSQGHSPFLETNTYEELEKQLEVGSTVSLNARKISGTILQLQATAVWVSTNPPTNYKTPQLVADLNSKLNDFISAQTGDVKYRSNPLYGSPDNMVAGEVKEYLSYETGLILLSSGLTALFHLNQVWAGTEKKVLYKTVQDKPLDLHLPIGAEVWVNYREIPAGEDTDLKYQATIVCSRAGRDEADHIPKEYIDKFQPYEARLTLVAELDRIHDLFKKNLRKHRPITNTNFIPVHAVLNGLPGDWIAEIVAAVDQDFGIIKISHSLGHSLGRGVNFIYSLFHIEDVYDYNGNPSIQNPKITMSSVMNCKVNLTARSISRRELDPEKLMDEQRELMARGGEDGAVPLLQAVVVCLKLSADSEICYKNIPKPTHIRAKPDSFGNLGSFFYLNPLLYAKLDIKLKAFLAVRKKLNLPYDKILKTVSIGENHEKHILETWRELDVNQSYQFVYGTLPSNMDKPAGQLPRILTKHPVKLVYIHTNRFKAESGVFELQVEVGEEKVTTFAFFELSRYKFFSRPDSFATDLVNIMRISSTDRFYIHAMLSNHASSSIRYIALSVWNEDLRLELKQDVPLDFRVDNAYAGSTKQKIKAIESLVKKPVRVVDLTESLDFVFPENLEVPEMVGTVTSDVKSYDGNKVLMENSGKRLVTVINNKVGYISHILTDQLAILRFSSKERSFKVLVSAEDVFLLDINQKFNGLKDFQVNNKLKFSSPKDLWARTAANMKKSLFEVFEVDQKITFNAVPLLSNPEENNADIWYVSSGVLVTGGEHRQFVTVPVNCVTSSNKLTEDFKMYFMKIIRNVTTSGQNESESIPRVAPAKFPPDFYVGEKGKLALRSEYLQSSGTETTGKKKSKKKTSVGQIAPSVSLPAPVSVKRAPPKPVCWDPIITGRYGRVLKIVDKNYGVAASYVPLYEDSNECESFQFLFDIFDIYVGEKDCNDLGKKLPDVLSVGDFVKFNAAKVDMEGGGSERDIQYLATSMITDTGVEDIREREIPDSAPVISDINQVTASKIENFKVVAGFLNKIKLTPEEEDIINYIKSGGLLSKFASRIVKPRISTPIEIDYDTDVDEGSDEEITVIETISDNKAQDTEIPIGDLKPKDLRSLISSYNGQVSRHVQNRTRGKYCLRQLRDETKLGKELTFFQDFLISLGRKCRQSQTGFKVGHIFVTSQQVKSIVDYGIMSKDDIENEFEQASLEEDYEEVLKKFPFQNLRKFVIDFNKYLCSRLSLEEVGKNCELSLEESRKLMKAVSLAVEKAPVEGGKVQGIRVENIFISSNWVQKIQEHHRKTKQ